MNISKTLNIIRHMSKTKNSKIQDFEKQTKSISFDKNGNIMLHILAKPGAKANEITGIEEEGIGIRINARAVEGEANSELLSYVSQLLKLKKNEISLEKGMKSRQKTLLINKKGLTPDEIIQKLKEEMKQ